VWHQRIGGLLLFRSQFTMKHHIQRRTRAPLISQGNRNIEMAEELLQIGQTTTRQADVSGMVLGARDDPRFAVRRQAHCLRPEKLWILKCRKVEHVISELRTKCRFGDVDLVSEDELKRMRQFTVEWSRRSTGRWRLPRLILLIRRQAKSEDPSASFSFGDDSFDMVAIEFPHR
jgi:hypothetical protein